MVPALVVSAGALTARIAALARSAAPAFGTVLARLRTSAGFVGKSADDVIKYAKASPANASMVALTLASVGVSVADLFETDAGKDAAARVAAGSALVADFAKIDAAGAVSEKLNLAIAENASDLKTASEVLGFAKRHYGSAASAIRAHRLHQAFFEMPRDDVIAGFDTLAL